MSGQDPRGSLGLNGPSLADQARRVACLEAASRDDLVRKVGVWGFLARDGADDPSFTAALVATLLKAGLLEPVGMRDERGRVVRARASMMGRRELARRARAAGGGA